MNPIIDTALSIVEFIIIFGIMIFIHELGHFLTGKFFKVKIDEFGFGYPPRLLKMFTLGETDFTLNWIPFGGFNRFRGENDPSVPGSFAAENPWKRLVILSGGSILNLVTGVFLFSLVFSQIGAPDPSRVEIIGVAENSPAFEAGIISGDIVLEINNESINSMEQLGSIVAENVGREIQMLILRYDEQIEIATIPRTNPPEGEGALGIVMSNPIVEISWVQATPYAVRMTIEQCRQLLLLPGRLIRGQIAPEQARIVGPVGIYSMYNQARELDQEVAASTEETLPAVNSLWLLAVISVALGLSNLLPIPAFDGGRILFILPEILLRRRVPPNYENIIHFVGFATMLALLFYITFQDIINPVVLP
ncbi:MAG: M50 family metallopeptidase [Anaerolineaceae bacterium]|nr:M50 family metallopeptidase [Anaerolineaceae bacterium]